MSKDPVSRKTGGLGYALYETRPLQEHPSSQVKRKLGGERKGGKIFSHSKMQDNPHHPPYLRRAREHKHFIVHHRSV